MGRSGTPGKVRRQEIWEGQEPGGKSGSRKYGKSRSLGESQGRGDIGRAGAQIKPGREDMGRAVTPEKAGVWEMREEQEPRRRPC